VVLTTNFDHKLDHKTLKTTYDVLRVDVHGPANVISYSNMRGVYDAVGSPLVERYVQFGVCRPGGHLVVQDFAASGNWMGSNRDPSDSGDEEAEKRG
jgi:hypothetical protein